VKYWNNVFIIGNLLKLNADELKQLLIAAWFGIQQNVVDQAIDQWRVHLNACVKAKGKHFENILCCAVPQLSIICYETYIQLFFVSQLLTSHDFKSFSFACWTIFGTFIEFRTVKSTLSVNVKFLHRFVTNTFRWLLAKKWHTTLCLKNGPTLQRYSSKCMDRFWWYLVEIFRRL